MVLSSYQRILPSVFDMENSDGNGNKEVIWYIDYSFTNQLYNQEMDNDIIRSGGKPYSFDFLYEI